MEPVGGWLDNLWTMFQPDPAKIDKPKMKSAMSLLLDAMKPATTWPGNFDDTLYDQLKDIFNNLIDKLGVQEPITVGASASYVESAREFTAAETNAFLATCQCSEERKQRVRGSKRIMKTLYATDNRSGQEVFTDEDRRKVVGAFPWLMLLQILGPLLIDLIKRWLSKE